MTTTPEDEKRIPDTKYRTTVEKRLNRVFKRYDLQPPAVTRFTLGIIIFWLMGAAISYQVLPSMQGRAQVRVALLYSWSTFILQPRNGAAMKDPIAWGILLTVMLPVIGQALAASGAAKRARYLVEASKLAKQQGRKHPADVLEKRSVSDGIPLGEYQGKRFGIRRGADAGHVLVAAPTRAGKGLHLTGTLETWHGPAVVVDPKREQYERTSGERAKLGPIYCIPQHGIDILQYFNVHNALDLQELFTTLLQTWQDKDPIFSQKAYAVFEAARDQSQATGEHMLKILARWADISAPAAIKEAAHYAPGPIAKFTDGNTDELNRFTLSAWGTFTAKFSTIAPHIDTISQGDVPTRWAEQDSSIYICYPLDQLEAAGGLLSVILGALMKGQQRAQKKNYTLFAIDELRASRLHGLDTKLATVGGYGITILAYLQQLSQLKDVYGHDAAASIIGNFHHQIFYPTRDNESAEYISRKFGTEIQATRSYGSDSKASYSQRTSDALEPSMINTLPPTTTIIFTDDITTAAQRVNPFTNRKTPLAPPQQIIVKNANGTIIYNSEGRIVVRTNAGNTAPATRPITRQAEDQATDTSSSDTRSQTIESAAAEQSDQPPPGPATMEQPPAARLAISQADDLIIRSSAYESESETAAKEGSNTAIAEAGVHASLGEQIEREPQKDARTQGNEEEEIYF